MDAMTRDSPPARVVMAFDSTVPAAERQNLVAALTEHGVVTRRSLDLGYRSPGPDEATVVTVAVLTMLSTSFLQRFGEQTADQVIHVFTAARDWLRRRGTSRAAPAHIEIVDQASGVEFRVSAGDPDAAGRLLSEALRAASVIRENRPLDWDGNRWAPHGKQRDHAKTRRRPTVEEG